MLVKLWMQTELITVREDTTISEAKELMEEHKIRRLPVLGSDQGLVGILSSVDIRNALPSIIDADFDETARALTTQAQIAAFMTTNPITVTPMDPLEKVAAKMRQNKIGGIPVTDQGRLVGIITESDIFKAFIEILGGNAEGARIEISIGCEIDTIYTTLDLFRKHEMNLLTLTVCDDFSATSRLLTIRFHGKNVDILVDELWNAGCKINNIIKE